MLESPTIHRVDSYQRSILNGLAKVERMMTQYYGEKCKPVAAVLVSEGDLSVCKRGAIQPEQCLHFHCGVPGCNLQSIAATCNVEQDMSFAECRSLEGYCRPQQKNMRRRCI